MILLSNWDLAIASLLVILLATLSWHFRLGLTQRILVAAARTAVQLSLIGLVLKTLFAQTHPLWVGLMALFMLAVAAREIGGRQQRRFTGVWNIGLGSLAMFLSSFSVIILVLNVVVRPDPWYSPQYAIPLLGMMLGNTLTGISLSMDRLTQTAWQQRHAIESRLTLGQSWKEAISDVQADAARAGLTPIINAMAVAGLVSLPGMMTGQILAGADPLEAVKYQILIMFMISAGTGLGTFGAVWLGARRLFDERQRLRLDRLTTP